MTVVAWKGEMKRGGEKKEVYANLTVLDQLMITQLSKRSAQMQAVLEQ